MGSSHLKILIAVAVLGAVVSGALPTSAQNITFQARPQVCDDPTNNLTLFAERIGKNKIGYGLTPENPTIPGPTIEMTEGECLQVTLVNDTDRTLGMHAHGVAYTVASDGTPLNKSCVAPGRSRSYAFLATAPATRTDGSIDPGSAGYWHYHDHCMGTPHGTEGIRSGLFGALIVRKPQDPAPAKTFVVVMSERFINLKKAPNTPTFEADEGQRVEFVVIGHGELFHTFHLHGHRWVDNRTGAPSSLTDDLKLIDNKTLGPAESFGFQVIAGEHVGPGAWMYHCHVQGHSDAGMSGIFMVKTPGGMATEAGRKALERFRASHATSHH